MNIKGIFATIGKTAIPMLAAAVVPGSPVIGVVAHMIGEKFNLPAPIEHTADAVEAAVTALQKQDPQTMIKMQEIEVEFKKYMAQLGVNSVQDMEALNNVDRASARAMQIATRDWVPRFLAVGVTIGFFGLLGALAWHEVPKDSQPIIFTMVGSLGTAWIGMINYYFGSSSGSAAKTAILAEQTQTLATNVVDFKKAA